MECVLRNKSPLISFQASAHTHTIQPTRAADRLRQFEERSVIGPLFLCVIALDENRIWN